MTLDVSMPASIICAISDVMLTTNHFQKGQARDWFPKRSVPGAIG